MLARVLRSRARAERPRRSTPSRASGLFWHFVDLVWILVFTFVYLIPAPPPGAGP